jgi:ATP adenylyltransferase/5',5'''-P-1,P-4-tetraphosphate phosphorylase II
VYSDKINDLFASQLPEWELAKVNYNQLEKVKTRNLDFGDYEILVQFNPERIRSSAAKVDAKSLGARPCFLCPVNRPAQQHGVAFENDMTVLVNPFPIFSRHLTIPSDMHLNQRIKNNFVKMLSLAKAIPDYVIFYNGPECGASAPDHFHFQAGNRGFMPVERDFSAGKHTRLLSSMHGIEIWQWKNYLRGIITLKGYDKGKLVDIFNHIFNKLSVLQPEKPEPMLNILAYHSTEGWIIHLIPRILHRPSQFFAEGNDQILLSPASVDLGGVIITPREEDFNRISKDDVADIFSQVCLAENQLPGFISELI